MTPSELFEQLVAEIMPDAICANDPIPQMTLADLYRLEDELVFRHALEMIALLPENALQLIVAHQFSVTPETDSRRWN